MSSEPFLDALERRLAEGDPVAELKRRVRQLEQELAKLKTGGTRRKRVKLGKVSQAYLNALLPRLRQKNPHDWAIGLTDKQELCARLRWDVYMNVSDIARVLGVHHSTVAGHLARVDQRTQGAVNFGRRQKRRASNQ